MKRKFSAEFKAETVKLVLEQGLAPAQAARDMGIGSSTMDKWLKAARGQMQPEAITGNEKEELKRLRKEIYYLKMERDILKKATAYFSGHRCPMRVGHEEQSRVSSEVYVPSSEVKSLWFLPVE